MQRTIEADQIRYTYLTVTLDRDLREEIGRRIETVALNPLENDLEAEQESAAAMDADVPQPPDERQRTSDVTERKVKSAVRTVELLECFVSTLVVSECVAKWATQAREH